MANFAEKDCKKIAKETYKRKDTMAKINLCLDLRRVTEGQVAPIKISIAHKSKTAYIPLEIRVLEEQWDKSKLRIIKHPHKDVLNSFIQTKRSEVELAFIELLHKGELKGLDAYGIKDKLLSKISPTDDNKDVVLFAPRYLAFTEQKSGRTKEIYQDTYNRLLEFCPELEALRIEDITKSWLLDFEKWLQEERGNSVNTRFIHFRNIRAVFNEAIDDELITFYPFRKFKLKGEQTPKRSLSAEQIKAIFDLEFEPSKQAYIDLFKLSFLLIGINFVDLLHLERIILGRIEYKRSKTKRLYSIKVEPEMLDIINKYKGKKRLLKQAEGCEDYRNASAKTNAVLKEVMPELTTYWARHSWATIAASLDIPKETIAQALGHGGNTVTDIYIDFDRKKIDEANRRVIDWVLYGKK